jgi:glycosyltransferase involved in cell wall biosynthesis
MSKPLTICYVIVGLDYAGAEIQLVEVVRRLRERGHRIFVISLITPAAFVRELGRIGVSVVSLDLAKGASLTLDVIGRFLRAVREIRPDVIHGHMVHSNLLARLAAGIQRIPVALATVHSTDEGGRSRAWMYRLTQPLGTLTTSVSEAGREVHLRTGASTAGRIEVVPNGIDTRRFARDPEARRRVRAELGVEDDRFVWLTVARFAPPKDPQTLLRALAQTRTDSALWLVGQGADRDAAIASVAPLGLEDRARFLGVRTDIPDLLSACDGFVLSSRSEAMPITLLEAGCSEVPCVASDTGEVGVMIENGKTGLVVPPADAEALAHALFTVEHLDRRVRREMGALARQRVQARWSLDAVVDRWERLYASHLSSPTP